MIPSSSFAAALQTQTRGRFNLLVLNVAKESDPFLGDYPHWPLENYLTVHDVPTSLNTRDPPLFTPVITGFARANAIRDRGGYYLSCGDQDHSFKSCSEAFLNTSGTLNPAMHILNDDGHTFRQWQQRMRYYRTRDYDRHLQRNTAQYAQGNHDCHSNG